MRNNSEARLNTKGKMPLLGLGTYSPSSNTHTTQHAIHMALKMGYRHFDTAKIYGSEAAVGKAITGAISEGMVEREDIFLTSKLWSSDHHDPVSALKQTLGRLGMEYVDLYLVHWPVRFKPWVGYPVPNEDDFEELDMESTWSGMERCLDLGLCSTIGVSNFSATKILHLFDSATVCPAVNQVEMHPTWRQTKLRRFCLDHGIHTSAYMPLGGPGNSWGSTTVLKNPIIQSIAQKHKATSAQVALAWGMQNGASVIVKSFNEARMRENMGALNVKLDEDDMLNIEKLEERKILRGDHLVNNTTSPFKSTHDLWDDDI